MGVKPFLLVLQAWHVPQLQHQGHQSSKVPIPTRSHPDLLQSPAYIDCSHTEAPRASGTRAGAAKGKAFPLTGSPLPCPGTWARGGRCIPQVLLKSPTLGAFSSAQRQVPGVGIWVRVAFSPGCQPPMLAGHTRGSTQYFLNTRAPADERHWSSDYSFPSTHWHDRL